MFKRILVPLDGSPLAEKVLALASFVAQQYFATLVLFHVVEKDSPNTIHGQRHLRQVGEAHAYLDQIAKKLTSAEIACVQHVHESQEAGVAQTIREHAEELSADLIVLCAHGNGGLRDQLYGSIAQQVIRDGTVPVLFIRPNHTSGQKTHPIRRILLPLDGSKSHEVAIPVAISMAEKFGAKITLMTVVPTTETLPIRDALAGRVSPRATNLTLDSLAQQAEGYLHRLSQDLLKQGVSVSKIVSRGDIPSKIIEVIEKEPLDLVVLATHGNNAIDAHWGGNLTPRFLPASPVPVMLVRGRKEENRPST
jgi:nucleotide-binding universal stress UspA family protein